MAEAGTGAVRRDMLVNVQILRFLAAALVLFGHLQHEAGGRRMSPAAPFEELDLLDWGIGVDIFFVISGFIIVHMTADRFGTPGMARDFLLRRLVRVAPSYWFFTTLMLGAAVLMPSLVVNGALSAPHVLASYAFVPWPRADGLFRPLLALGWTLNYEMFFYACFAGALLLPLRRGLLALTAGFGALVVLAALTRPEGTLVGFWGDAIILEFLAGIGLGLLYRRGLRIGLPTALALAAAGFGLAALLHGAGANLTWHRVVTGGLPGLMIAAAFILCRTAPSGRTARLMALGGDASYALYLSHPFAISLLATLWGRLLPGYPWGFVAAGMTVATGAAVLFHLAVERPVNAALARRLSERHGRVPLPAAA
jgi:peptidoglycan/LPS O-acetylase OafA/YrhL